MSVYALTIDGNTVTDPILKSMSVVRSLGRRSTAAIILQSEPEVGHRVGVYKDATRLFGGSIENVTQVAAKQNPQSTEVLFQATCTSHEHRLDKRYVGFNGAPAVYGQTFSVDPSTDVFTSYDHELMNGQVIQTGTTDTLPTGLAEDTDYTVTSATTNTFQLSGVNVSDTGTGSHDFRWKAGDIVTDVLTNKVVGEQVTTTGVEDGAFVVKRIYELASVADVFNDLAALSGFIWYVDPDSDLFFGSTSTNSAPFNITDSSSIRNIKIRKTREQYRNRQFYRFSWEALDPSSDEFSGDGSTQEWYLTDRAIQIEGMTLDGEAVSYGVAGADTSMQFYWAPGEKRVYQDSGETPLASGQSLEVSYRALGENVARRDNSSEQTARATVEGATGIYSAVMEDTTNADAQSVLDHTDAKLAAFDEIALVLDYETTTDGFAPGQTQSVTLSAYGLSSVDFLIDQVTVRTQGFANLYYQVRAVSAAGLEDWIAYFAGGQVSGALPAGRNSAGQLASGTIKYAY